MVPLRLALPLEGRGGVERRGGGGGGGEVVRAAVAGEESRFDVGDHRGGPADGVGGGGGGGGGGGVGDGWMRPLASALVTGGCGGG